MLALEHWQIAPEEELLDIGCGGGATLKRMGEKITTGHLTGIDYSPVSVKTSLKTNRQDVESGKMKFWKAPWKRCLLQTMDLTRSLR